MNAFTKLEKLLKDLNLYEFEILECNDSFLEFFLIIDYSYEFLDVLNYEFEKYLKEKCFFEYDNVMHSRLTLAPIVRVDCKVWSEKKILNLDNFKSDFDFFISFPNDPMDFKLENELKIKYIELTRAFIIRILNEISWLIQKKK